MGSFDGSIHLCDILGSSCDIQDLYGQKTESIHYPANCSRYLQANTEGSRNSHNFAEKAFRANIGSSISQLGIGAIRGLALLDYFLAFLASLCWMKSSYNSQKFLCTSLCSPFIFEQKVRPF